MVLAQTLEEVISRLEQIIMDSKEKGDRNGYFAALYHKVTVAVKEGIEKGQFTNGNNLARLDVTFANRYFAAYDEWQQNRTASSSWTVAFENAEKPSRLVLQHLLLGINAHINLDLGIAAVEVANGNINSLRDDYASINMILSALTYGVIHKLNVISPLLSFLGFSGTGSTSMLVQFSMGNARDGSWVFAENLALKVPGSEDYHNFIVSRDQEIAALGQSLTQSKGVFRIGIWLIHLFEKKNVRKVISILTDYKKLYRKQILKISMAEK